MNRLERRRLEKKAQSLPADLIPQLNELIATAYDPRPWLHGGVPGLEVGDVLLPRLATGNANGSCDAVEPDQRVSRIRRPDAIRRSIDLSDPADAKFVYITKAMTAAHNYAVAYAGKAGTIYEIEPVGPVTVDEYMVRLAAHHPEVAELLEWQIRAGEMPLACCCESAVVREVLAQPWHEPEGSEFYVTDDDILEVGTMDGKHIQLTARDFLNRTEAKARAAEPEPLPDLSSLSRQQRRHFERRQRKSRAA